MIHMMANNQMLIMIINYDLNYFLINNLFLNCYGA